ncbi:MAG: serine hydrolase [Armatimonadota bacterium]
MISAFVLSLTLARQAPFDEGWKYAEKFNSQAMLVSINGKLVFEKYANGGGEGTSQAMASGSKSFCGVVAAAAATDKLLTYDENVADTFVEWKNDPKKSKITVRHLLSLSSGLPVGVRGRDAGEREGWETAKAATAVFEPGEQFAYGPNSFNIFGSLIEAKLKNESWEQYLDRRIMKPLGISMFYRGKCADGKPQLAGGGWIKPRDWITFGQFVMADGKWKGKQLIDAKLMKELYLPSKANPGYGMSWWLSDADEASMMTAKADPSADGFRMAAGAGKQRLYIIPKLKMVALRMGKVSGAMRGWSDREFLELITKSSK